MNILPPAATAKILIDKDKMTENLLRRFIAETGISEEELVKGYSDHHLVLGDPKKPMQWNTMFKGKLIFAIYVCSKWPFDKYWLESRCFGERWKEPV